jgi:hypothetical protein
MDTLDSETLSSWVRRLKPSTISNSTAEFGLLYKLSVLFCRDSDQHLRNTIASSGEGPCLYSYQSDGWGVKLRKQLAGKLDDVAFQRYGFYRIEFLNERSIVKTIAGGQIAMAMKFNIPRKLAGRKALNVFTAASEYFPILPSLHTQGISISHYLQDGLFVSSIGRLMDARHRIYHEYANADQDDDTDDGIPRMLLDWTKTERCAAHAGSSAIKWGLDEFTTKQLLEDVHVVMGSLGQGNEHLHAQVDTFVVQSVSWEARDISSDCIRAFWAALDVEPALLDTFCSINPLWNGKSLVCEVTWSEKLDALATIGMCVRYCLRFMDFSDTRWGKVGVVGRLFCRAWCVGLQRLYKLVVGDNDVSMYGISGFSRCNLDTRMYLVMAGLSVRAVEGFIVELLEDDRVARRYSELIEGIHIELEYLHTLTDYVWDVFGKIVDRTGHRLRHLVLNGARKSIAYLHLEVFRHIQAYPDKLTFGDIEANLETFANLDVEAVREWADPMTWKMKCLLELGYSTRRLVEALELWKDRPCTVALTEKAHGSGAVMAKQHSQYGGHPNPP